MLPTCPALPCPAVSCCDLWVQVDLGAAIGAGIRFCRAANGVVLSEGPVPLQYVHRIKVGREYAAHRGDECSCRALPT